MFSPSWRRLNHFPFELYQKPVHSYPGHIYKARWELKKILNLKDTHHVIIEVRDSRVATIVHPDLELNYNNCKKIVLFNKLDLIDDTSIASLKRRYPDAIFISKIRSSMIDSIVDVKNSIFSLMNCSDEDQIHELPLKRLVHVVGYPNVGKTTIVNQLRTLALKKGKQRTANSPGTTRMIEKLRFFENPKIDLVDFPGVLVPPKEMSPDESLKLCLVNSCTLSEPNLELLVHFLLYHIKCYDSMALSHLKIPFDTSSINFDDIMESVANSHGFLIKGGRPNVQKAMTFILNKYRSGSMTKIPLTSV
eukprot:NODE_8_length_66115_cov_0.981823.p22 type:complete len:306 gc:universal NODE_8_length_66115_cov_0.981823:47908-48825(+)